MSSNLRLPFEDGPRSGGRRLPGDEPARRAAVDPARNVVLEASAGTGKTRVLVDRYLNLLGAGVEPLNILAVTFTRKAAAEMRERIISRLRDDAAHSPEAALRWRDLRDRLNEIAISTIDAFCLALLREFPLEADLDPGFDVADETAVPRLIEASLDRTMRIGRGLARDREELALLFAQLGERNIRQATAALLNRRHVAAEALGRALSRGPRDLTIDDACRRGVIRLAGALTGIPGGLDRFLDAGPVGHPGFALLARDVRALVDAARPGGPSYPPPALRGLLNRLEPYFFTKGRSPRQRTPREYAPCHASKAAARAHWLAVHDAAPAVGDAALALRRDLNVILSRAVWQLFAVASAEYRRTLDRAGVLDFAELLSRASDLLSNMDEFARSRYLLEARYRHVLVDEFQDTSRAQWQLVRELVRAWGEGFGAAHDALQPSIFVVGDRKQSIYGFRDADVSLLDEAARAIVDLRPDQIQPVQTITHSFRSAPPLLAFVNDLFAEMPKAPDRADAFRYDDRDRFPIEDDEPAEDDLALGLAVADTTRACAAAVAAEIARVIGHGTVRDRTTGVRRPAEPGDVAVLFRVRESHRAFEAALDAVGVPTYVYKGLGFFDADEVKDVVVLARYLADPLSDLRAAALLRSRLVRVSDAALATLAPGLARALGGPQPPPGLDALDAEDRAVIERARTAVAAWRRLADTAPPAEVIDRILAETAYPFEWRGPRLAQARENVKKIRGLVRRLQNRGYLTFGRLAEHLDTLSAGDDSNAVVDAINAVNLMTVHAAKGLEFPVVFVVGLERGAGGRADPIRVTTDGDPDEAVAVGDYSTDFDEDAGNRETEESKRLLYVALTRARDRLYLAAEARSGVLKPGRGSLAAVLPDSVRGLFSTACAPGSVRDALEWRGASGRTHRFRVCPPGGDGGAPPHRAQDEPRLSAPAADPPARGGTTVEDFEAVDDRAPVHYVAATAAGRAEDGPRPHSAGTSADRSAIGRVVHRLFQFAHEETDERALGERASRLLRDDERFESDDPDQVVVDAVALFGQLRDRPDVRELFAEARCLFEVPFSLRADADAALARLVPAGTAAGATVVRGVIDCLALRPEGGVVVVDFKTGAPRQPDQDQMAIYVAAARQLFPGRHVEGRLVYQH